MFTSAGNVKFRKFTRCLQWARGGGSSVSAVSGTTVVYYTGHTTVITAPVSMTQLACILRNFKGRPVDSSLHLSEAALRIWQSTVFLDWGLAIRPGPA